MSGLLRPVGPEPTWTYWVRRALVIGVLAVSISIIVTAVRALGSPESTPAVPPASSGAPSASGTPKADPTPSAGSSDSPRPPTSPHPSGSPSPTGSASPSGSPSPSGPASPSGSPSPSASPTPSGTPKPGASPTPTAAPPAKPTACAPDELRLTLIGKRAVRAEKDSDYQLSVINGGKERCVVTLDHDTFTFTITSGSDAIWSSKHCARTLKAATKTLASEESLAWTMTWNGERSRQDCKDSDETPRPGIYWATADLDGAEPVRWRMTLTD